MRFVKGPIPESSAFQPEINCWNAVRELDPKWIRWLTYPFGLPVAICLYWISNLQVSEINSLTLLIIFIGFYPLIPIHEYIHALFMPKSNSKEAIIFGYWKEKRIFFTHYEGEMKKGRLIIIMIAPLLCISIMPVIILTMLGINIPILTGILIFHTILCGGDLYGISGIAFQIPNGALVRNKGWKTYWRLHEEKT